MVLATGAISGGAKFWCPSGKSAPQSFELPIVEAEFGQLFVQ